MKHNFIRHLHLALIAILLIAAVGIFTPAIPAYASSYSVATAVELISAINSANATASDDIITLTADITLSTVDNTSSNGTNGLPVIVSTATGGKLTIEGGGFSISRSSAGGTPDFRIFEVASGADLTLDNVTISNGSAAPTFSGGGIQNNGTLNLLNSTITGSISFDAGGAGIYNSSGGNMTVTNSTFSGNHLASGPYGGGGILNNGNLSVTNSTFSNNLAASGGGISNGSTLTVTNSTFDNNIGFGSLENYGTLNITNSTISGQLGIASDFASATATLYNTIVDTNSSACLISSGAINADAYNIASDGTCDNATVKSSAQINLQSLTSNGGPTQTMALGAGSAAIDAGDATVCSASPVNNLDQRGVTRPVNVTGIAGATCDIGAYEANPTQLGPSFIVNTNADTNDGSCDLLGSGIGNQDCTLREAINAANAHRDADTVTFASGLSGATITLGSTLPAISDELTVDGSSLASPITISGNNSVEVMSVNSGKILTINTLMIANGRASNGGGIYNGGTLTVTNSTFSNNSASNSGGGIDNSHGTMLTVTDSTFTGNSGGSGGAINNNVAMNVSNSTFFNNNAAGVGGGIDNGSGGVGTTVTNTTFSGNTTASSLDGGGIGNFGELTLKNSIIANSGTGGDCHIGGAGSLTADSHNLADDNTCGSATQKTSVQINLQSLASNGGPTQTMALGAGSAAIDVGDDGVCIAAPVNNLDQRGKLRTQGASCDVGAYEAGESTQSGSPSFIVTTSDDHDDGVCGTIDCTLREAINAANVHSGADTITFDSSLSGATITLGSTLPALSGDVKIDGSSLDSAVTISGNNSVQVMSTNYGVNVTLNALTIANGETSVFGGGIDNFGALTVMDSTFLNNNASGDGGGIYVNAGSSAKIINSTFFGNSASGGGGGGGISKNDTSFLTVINSTFSGNTAAAGGGGISAITTSASELTLENTIIANSTNGDCRILGSLSASNTLMEDSNHACGLTNGSNGNIVGSDPNLAALANNGGPTQTMALLSGSPAIDKGNDTVCAASPVNNLDQRGVTRPQGKHCDIGAYELVIIPIVTVNQAAGQSDPTVTSPIHFTTIFNEPINTSTFTASDVTLGGTVSGTLSAVVTQIAPNDGTTFDIAVSGMTGFGTVTSSIPANAVKDPAGNPNTASTSTDNTVTFGKNLIVNGGFNTYIGISKIPQYWSAQNFSLTDGKITTPSNVEEGLAAVQIGFHNPSLMKTLLQPIMLNGAKGDKFTFSFWVKGNAISTAKSCAGQVLFYANNHQVGPGTPDILVATQTIQCTTGTFAFLQKTLSFTVPAAYYKIVVQFTYSGTTGTVWLDNAVLSK